MSFLIYFFVLLVSAASVLFGLDLMNSPLPNTPNVPIGRSVQVVSPPPAQRETRAADERALTPVYPTEPGKPKVQAETSGATPQDNASLTPPSAQPKVEPAAAAQPALQQSARLPKPQQTARQSTKGAMGGAERIAKRQPLQLMPSAPQTMAPAEMSESERIVRRMTRNESGDIPVQDGEGNIIIVRKSYR